MPTAIVSLGQGIGNIVLASPALRTIADRFDTDVLLYSTTWATTATLMYPRYRQLYFEHPDRKYDIGLQTPWGAPVRAKLKSELSLSFDKHEALDALNATRNLTALYNAQNGRLLPAVVGSPNDLVYAPKAPAVNPLNIDVALTPNSYINIPWDRRNWPHMKELVIKFQKKGLRVAAIITTDPRSFDDQTRSVAEEADLVIANQELPVIAALISKAKFYIGPDCGITHIAAAIGLHTYVIWGPTSYVKNQPIGPNVHRISLDLDCAPCQNTTRWAEPRTCRSECTADLSPRQVIGQITETQENIL